MSDNTQNENKQLAFRLLLIVIAGVAFSFALPPLYYVVCEAIGLNGKADTTATIVQKDLKVDKTRTVTVLFTGNTMPGLDWEFSAKEPVVKVHPGEITLTAFYAKNNGAESVVGAAVPSVAPEVAALYFKKIECFCFNQQTLKAGESKEMPIRFFVSPDLPKDITTVTLSYAFYNRTDKVDSAKVGTTAEN